MISLNDFSKIELKVGTVMEAEEVEGSERLIKLMNPKILWGNRL